MVAVEKRRHGKPYDDDISDFDEHITTFYESKVKYLYFRCQMRFLAVLAHKYAHFTLVPELSGGNSPSDRTPKLFSEQTLS